MAVQTRQAIVEYTLKLMETKSIQKITIHDIVSGCGITRNTFYYYFHDIFDVIDSLVREKLAEVEQSAAGDFEKSMFQLMEFVSQHKKVWVNLLKSLGQENLSQYIIRGLHRVLLEYIKAQAGDKEISERDVLIISVFFEEALFGILVRWVKGELDPANIENVSSEEEIAQILKRIGVLFDGAIDIMVRNAVEHPPVE